MYLLREETDVTEYRYTSEIEEKLLKTPLPLRKLGIGINYWYNTISEVNCARTTHPRGKSWTGVN